MSKFMLSMGLVLALLMGFSGAVQAQRPAPGPLPLPTPVRPCDHEIGKWATYEEADAYAKAALDNPTYSDAWVVKERDGYYYVRLKF